MINKVVLVGRMTRDPELRRTQNGTAVTSFTLALNRSFNSADGQTADFVSCVVWSKLAANVERYCSKGSLVGVEGELRSRIYENSQGQKVFVVEVLCNAVKFIETKAMRERNQQESMVEQSLQPNNDFYNTEIGLGKEFDDLENTFDIREEDIQF